MPERAPGIVAIRGVEEADLPIFFLHQQDHLATEMAGYPTRDRKTFMRHWTRMLNDGASVARTILHDAEVAGYVVCSTYGARREVSYWLGRDFWGQGIATRGLSIFLEQETTRPLHAHVARHNIASTRVLAKCGFEIVREHRHLRLLKLSARGGGVA